MTEGGGPSAAPSYSYERMAHWSDCDPAGIVFFAQYARWMSDGLIDMLLSLGIDPTQSDVGDKGSLPSLGYSIRFLGPVRLHERVTHTISVQKVGRSSVEFAHRIRNRAGVSLVEAEEKRVWVDLDSASGTMRSIPIPGKIRALLTSEQGAPR